jgi:hypothetical protein
MKGSRSDHSTQRAKILAELVSARGDWVPLYRVTQHAAQYNARVYELRRMGFVIRNRTREVDRVRHSWFRLERGPSEATLAHTESAPATPSFPTFGNLAKESYGVD